VRRGKADLVIAAAVAGLACVLALTGAPAILTALTGMALLAAPGYLLSKLLLGPDAAAMDRVLTGAALALSVPVLGGLALHAAGVPLHKPAWLALLAGLTRPPVLGCRGSAGCTPGRPSSWRLRS
jgi:hypothetical protein